MPPTTTQRPTIASLSARVDEHEERLEDHEARLDKYDAIIVRLDVLIDVLTRHVDQVAAKADAAIEGQALLKERNEGAHRWSTVAWNVATGLLVGSVMFGLGYLVEYLLMKP